MQFKDDRVAKARVVLSGAAPIPWRSKGVEGVLTGKEMDADTIAQTAETAVKNAEPLDQNGYKIPLFRVSLRRNCQPLPKREQWNLKFLQCHPERSPEFNSGSNDFKGLQGLVAQMLIQRQT